MTQIGPAVEIARAFHETYEDLAPQFGWETQQRSRKAWEDVPESNRALMVATVQRLLDRDTIRPSNFEVFTASDGHPAIRFREGA